MIVYESHIGNAAGSIDRIDDQYVIHDEEEVKKIMERIGRIGMHVTEKMFKKYSEPSQDTYAANN